MDFFEQQDQAHRQSKKLLFLFFLAVVAIVITVNVSLALIWKWVGSDHAYGHTYPNGFFLTNTVLVLLFIGGGTLLEMFRLRDGGDAVAQMAGGRLVDPASRDPQERRLLNIVEEMSLASSIACPRVYILDREEAINAFAAGYHQNEAVVAVTRGTIARLTRDELQGVIGHEFSHILNGDMRMNVKLIGVLFGIQMLASFGQELLYWGARWGSSSRSRDDKGPPIQIIMLAMGATFFVVGYVGIFFGRLIKSAVSRQREFLADASAVQFTRNPDGIGGALRKIGGLTRVNKCGSRIENPKAEQLSHMFLGAVQPGLLDGLFATHPPIEERLRRVYGKSVDFLDANEIIEIDEAGLPPGMYGFGARNALAAQAASGFADGIVVQTNTDQGFGAHANTVVETIPYFKVEPNKPDPNAIPAELINAARDAKGAVALLYALLLDRSDQVGFDEQVTILSQSAADLRAAAMHLAEVFETAPRSARLSLLDLAMPALKSNDSEQKKTILNVVHRLIAADQKMTQAEFVFLTLLERRLGTHAGRAVPIRFNQLSELTAEASLLVILIANSIPQAEDKQAALQRAIQAQTDLALQMEALNGRSVTDFYEVRQALEKLNQLAPLAKPFLIRLLLATAGPTFSADIADLLRAICAAIDAPIPEVVMQGYGTDIAQ